MSVLKYPARCETQPWQAGGAAVHMSAASVRIRADEVRHEHTDARKTRGLRPSGLSWRPV